MPTVKAIHPTASFEFDGNFLVKIILGDDAQLSMQDIIDHREIVDHMVNGRPYCMLAIAGERTQATEEGRNYAAKNISFGRIAEAVVIRSLPVRLMGNFYLKFHKPEIPTRLFDDQDEAVKWLTGMWEANNSSGRTTS